MEKQEMNSNIVQILEDLIVMDDFIIKSNKRLEIVLINLKIVTANGDLKGIQPITDELQRLIHGIDERVTGYITQNRPNIRNIIEIHKK
jgi:hypothetical protein